jgi:endonuclease-8
VPEGDTVYHTAQVLDQHLSGHVLTATHFRVPQHATADLAGGTVVETVSRGKHLLTRVDRGDERFTLHTHLKMEGSWRVLRPGQRWPRPAHTARVVLQTDTATAIGFSLGIVELVDRSEEEQVVGHLGPDLLGPDWDEETALANLTKEPGRPVREALLDQRNLAGIGNLYAAELCFTAGVHPQTAVAAVPDLRRLVRRAHQMLEVNKERWVQSTTGDLRERERTWVYRRDRSPCRRCGTPVVVDMQGPAGRARASYWCPACQPRLSSSS